MLLLGIMSESHNQATGRPPDLERGSTLIFRRAALAIYMAWYNFVRTHRSLDGATPAMALGIEDSFACPERRLLPGDEPHNWGTNSALTAVDNVV